MAAKRMMKKSISIGNNLTAVPTFEPVHPAQTAGCQEFVAAAGLDAAPPECEWPPSAVPRARAAK